MSKLILWTLLVVWTFDGYAQRERVHVDFDKYSCKAGDSIYFKGTIVKGQYPSSVSSNFYVELYTQEAKLIQRSMFPIMRGQSIGQIVLPETLETGNYFIVALTRQQLNYDTLDFFSAPILVYNREKPAIVNHKKQILSPATATAASIKGITWTTSFFKGKVSSLLEIDSGSRPRSLRLINPVNKDSAFGIDVKLDKAQRQKYSIFPIRPDRENDVLLLFEDSVLLARQVIHLKDKHQTIHLRTDTLDAGPFGANAWKLELPATKTWFTSIDVTDADRSVPSPVPITRLNDAYTDNFTIRDSLVDTAYISYAGKATREFGKKINDAFSGQIVIAGVRDSNYVFTKAVNMDPSGKFILDSLFFFGDLDLHFQLNEPVGASARDIRLSLSRFVPPAPDSNFFQANWEDDSVLIGKKDTAYIGAELNQYELTHFKTLKAAIVKAGKNPRTELDEEYATGPFSEPALFAYDLRTDTSEYDRDIFWYINTQSGRLHYDPRGDTLSDVLGHPIHYFVDETEYPAYAVRTFDFDRLAYVKILESDFLSTCRVNEGDRILITGNKDTNFSNLAPGSPNSREPLRIPEEKTALNVCIYTRKGNDFRTMRGGMNRMPIKGYSEIVPFKTDKITLYWHPLEMGHVFDIRFVNSETTKKFRVKVEAISTTGEVIHYETVVPE